MRLAIDGVDGVDDDVGVGEEVIEGGGALRGIAFCSRRNLRVWDDFEQLIAQHLHFWAPDGIGNGLALPVDVRGGNGIVVNQRKTADAGA